MKESISNGIKNYFQKDGKLTPEQSHENWMHEKLKNGWKYGAKKSEIKKTHPCMVPYKHLPEAQKVKDKLFLTIVETMQKW
ncbi:MAG: hypothetical protein JSU85_04850 [Candidatus Zixiibacteriota bacterium]|nr:MAG: hypothetical protein JSU85_04850 [candidate division Zixibacteria bacterium]